MKIEWKEDYPADHLTCLATMYLETEAAEEPCAICSGSGPLRWSFDHWALLCAWCFIEDVSEPAQLRAAQLDRAAEEATRVQKEQNDGCLQTMLFDYEAEPRQSE